MARKVPAVRPGHGPRRSAITAPVPASAATKRRSASTANRPAAWSAVSSATPAITPAATRTSRQAGRRDGRPWKATRPAARISTAITSPDAVM